MSKGVTLIAVERQRQIEGEGYYAEHDKGHADELAVAGAAYALPGDIGHEFWPWAERYWKPTPDDRVRQLTKAGALIAAAIDSILAPASETER